MPVLEVIIEDNIPIPTPRTTIAYPLEALEVGKSFLIPEDDTEEKSKIVSRVQNQAIKYEREGKKFIVRRRKIGQQGETADGVRVWRVA